MLRTFNCGVGMIVITSAKDSDAVMQSFVRSGEKAVVLGIVIKASGRERVVYDGKLNLR
jgi:phosphoribosylformylglycinamidine cyclo-ligase